MSKKQSVPTTETQRRLPIGAEFINDATVSLRVWAPRRRRVDVVVYDDPQDSQEYGELISLMNLPGPTIRQELSREDNRYFACMLDDVKPGQLYGFRLDDGPLFFADPASRFQPNGPYGLSQFVNPKSFRWTDDAWSGIGPHGQVLYEMHVGTLTRAGTWQSAIDELAELKRLGVTVLEVMPVSDFPGSFGWGYDGVAMFAPTRLYGRPDDFRRFVDRAHAVGLGVILDVVYNHFGNFGNYLGEFSSDYYTDRYQNEWAAAINFDGPTSKPVREFFLANARYWIEEFHLDGYRFDATQCVYDSSPQHILAEAVTVAREAAGERRTYFIAENEPQDVVHIRSRDLGGNGLDALWNDDFHHSACVQLTGKNPAYYSDYLGTSDELIAAVKRGFLYQGQRSQWQEKPRGTSTLGFPASAFVSFLQNHDQVANSATGERVHQLTSPGRFRAMTALWLLAPQTPLLFQGQEFGASSPFLFFADFAGNDGELIAKGRAQFLEQFPALRSPEAQSRLPDPRRRETFERCRLDLSERQSHQTTYDLHHDLLQLRRADAVFNRQRADLIDAATLSADCFVLRYFSDDGDDRLVLVNFGPDHLCTPTPQPLLAPPRGRDWRELWSSESPRYGGGCSPPVETEAGWRIPGEATVVLTSTPHYTDVPLEPGLRTHAESTAKPETETND